MKTGQNKGSLLALILSMTIFGTVGVFRRYIPLPSSVIALFRGGVGTLVLFLAILLRGKKTAGLGKNKGLLFLSGAMIGFNWILLFEAYNHTTVATATLCYYMAPVLVLLFSPLVLGEKWTIKKLVCIVAAFAGMVLVSGVLSSGFSVKELLGVGLGLGAAALYATVILLNKRIQGVEALDKTAAQMLSATVVLLPYVLLTEKVSALSFTGPSLALLLGMGIVHTGFAYVLYFGSLRKLSAHTAAIFSYIDPVVAVLLSALFLGETLRMGGVIGTLLILGAAVLGEMPDKKD
ncbi:MAG: EamA family transporter [Clostridia bacterium]|nr:EamA family transporter [Clostridia bacterium]